MILANIEWIGALCTFLSLACAIQLIITGIFAMCIPEVLLLTGSHLSTGAGLMSGFVALPTALRLKTAQISPNMDRIYGYTMCYQRLAISVSGTLHLIAVTLTISALAISINLRKDFKILMMNYHSKHSSKALVDNIQFVLQCCGGRTYEDWFSIDWVGYDVAGGPKRKKHEIREILREDTDAYPDLALLRNDAVPFSCCARSCLSSCIHQNLVQLGTTTINKRGCVKKLLVAVHLLLWCEMLIYGICLGLEIAVLALLRSSGGGAGSGMAKPKSLRQLVFKYSECQCEDLTAPKSTTTTSLSSKSSRYSK